MQENALVLTCSKALSSGSLGGRRVGTKGTGRSSISIPCGMETPHLCNDNNTHKMRQLNQSYLHAMHKKPINLRGV